MVPFEDVADAGPPKCRTTSLHRTTPSIRCRGSRSSRISTSPGTPPRVRPATSHCMPRAPATTRSGRRRNVRTPQPPAPRPDHDVFPAPARSGRARPPCDGPRRRRRHADRRLRGCSRRCTLVADRDAPGLLGCRRALSQCRWVASHSNLAASSVCSPVETAATTPSTYSSTTFDAYVTALLLLTMADHYDCWDTLITTAMPSGRPGAPRPLRLPTL